LVKPAFVAKIGEYLAAYPANEVAGAIDFFEHLKAESDIALSIATGGWGDTAFKKLKSAGFEFDGIPMASSNDNHSRTEIMKLASSVVINDQASSLTYFGDAEWDMRACSELGVNLVIVGNRVSHVQSISDFREVYRAMGFIELAEYNYDGTFNSAASK
jgi:hypothetical protein